VLFSPKSKQKLRNRPSFRAKNILRQRVWVPVSVGACIAESLGLSGDDFLGTIVPSLRMTVFTKIRSIVFLREVEQTSKQINKQPPGKAGGGKEANGKRQHCVCFLLSTRQRLYCMLRSCSATQFRLHFHPSPQKNYSVHHCWYTDV